MSYNLEIGKSYSKTQIESIFNTNFGMFIKGITLRKDSSGNPYTIIFSKENGPYSDAIIDNILYYDGEGQKIDQIKTAANNSLIEANHTNRTIYGFRKEEGQSLWKYLGLLKVIDYEYRKKNGFMTYEFKLLITEIDNVHEIQDQEIKNDEPLQLQEDPSYSPMIRKTRNSKFSTSIKQLYDYRCAVCGKRRFTHAQYPEVEAAHIYPVERNGSNDIRNGLALCKLHHWAFDGGLFSLSEDYTIIVKDDIKQDDNYKEIFEFEGKKILMPSDENNFPHPLFLREHRIIHGFE